MLTLTSDKLNRNELASTIEKAKFLVKEPYRFKENELFSHTFVAGRALTLQDLTNYSIRSATVILQEDQVLLHFDDSIKAWLIHKE